MVDRSSQYSGNVYDSPVLVTDAKYLESRVPYLGQVAEIGPRRFRYVSTVATFAAGEVVAPRTALVTETANTGYTTTAGDTSISLNTAGIDLFGAGAGVIAANELADGYLHIVSGAGLGYTYRIKSNPVATSAADITGVVLYDPIKVATAATSTFNITGNPWKKVIQGTAALPNIGVSMVVTAASTEQGFWIQTRGPGSILCATASGVTIGHGLEATASGSVIGGSSANTARIIALSMGSAATNNDTIASWLLFE